MEDKPYFSIKKYKIILLEIIFLPFGRAGLCLTLLGVLVAYVLLSQSKTIGKNISFMKTDDLEKLLSNLVKWIITVCNRSLSKILSAC